MILFDKGITSKDNYLLIYKVDGGRYAVNEKLDPDAWAEVQAWLSEHPDYVIAKDKPSDPTATELEAAAEAQRQAEFRWYDDQVWIAMQERDRGELTQEQYDAIIAPLYVFAKALRAMNNVEGWFRNPVWPTRPEV